MLAGMMKSHRFNFILDQRFILLAQSPKILFFANEIQRTVFPHNLVVLCLEIFNLSQYPLKVLLTLAKMSMILLFPEEDFQTSLRRPRPVPAIYSNHKTPERQLFNVQIFKIPLRFH